MEAETQPDEAKKICVVIDTNLWRSQLMLRTAEGVALLHYLRQSNSVLGMPEIIEREIVKQAIAAGTEFVEKIETNLEMLKLLTGSPTSSRIAYNIPTVDEIETQARSRLKELTSFTIQIPFTPTHALAALDRVNSGLPPNGPKNQQYKDSAIWEAILELARMHRIYFLTNDKGFYKELEKPGKGLADNLAAECHAMNGTVRIYRDLSSCLEDLQKHASPLDQTVLATAIERHLVASSLENVAAERNYRLTRELLHVSISTFATETFDTLALTFELTYRLSDLMENEDTPRLEPTLTTQGNCFYNQTNGEVSGVVVNYDLFRWKDITGHEFESRNVYAYASTALVFRSYPNPANAPRERVY